MPPLVAPAALLAGAVPGTVDGEGAMLLLDALEPESLSLRFEHPVPAATPATRRPTASARHTLRSD
ncbi:hypothetical protein WT67_05130 [Burkholderia stagnalis]|uniref:Uncharacterized protein n=1 Tax=Burkholderia stagnalis TaxID=1503054 RepID=A0A107U5D6_9BURK|nr:hypothetical protein [Burkholderia stagnalis]AOK55944.1 hypothetical protein WT74_24630 [Burkholderia stagnalis]KAB0641162.1 hypothetical protein F7R25_01170 [Burkholderia stagnalis]KVC57891.1 hypothetical protein WS59_04720 [Burkholderia stagnalis]KVD91069.1 hypothetical protein WS63_12440 [Burkholderia stagnalis]KVL90594.1 hypothetical protein WT02_22195 [Burkholderia stagnalis]